MKALFQKVYLLWLKWFSLKPIISVSEALSSPQEILVSSPDPLYSIPFFQILRQIYPHSKIRVLISEDKISPLNDCSVIDELIPYGQEVTFPFSRRFYRFKRILSRYQFDLAFDLSSGFSVMEKAFPLLSKAKLRIGFGGRSGFPFLNFEVKPGLKSSDPVKGNFKLLEVIGLKNIK